MLEKVGAEPVGERLRRERVLGQIAASAAMGDDDRRASSARRCRSKLELDHVPPRGIFVPRLPPYGVDDEPLVPADDLGCAFGDFGRDFRVDAERLDRDERQIARLRGVHLIRRPDTRSRCTTSSARSTTSAVLSCVRYSSFKRFLAAVLRKVIRHAAVAIEEVRQRFEVLEHAVVVGMARERVGHVDPNRIFLGHRSVPKSDSFRPYYCCTAFATNTAPIERCARIAAVARLFSILLGVACVRYTTTRMRLLLYNIRYGLGLGSALHWPLPGMGYLLGNRTNLQRITDFIKSQDPDVVGLIEVDTGSIRTRSVNQADVDRARPRVTTPSTSASTAPAR